jgi:hypothetical protein
MNKPYLINGQVTGLLAFSAAIEDACCYDAVKRNSQTPKFRGMIAARVDKVRLNTALPAPMFLRIS